MTILYFSKLPLQSIETVWKSSQEFCKTKVDKNGAIDTSVNWHVSQLPGFAPIKLGKWDYFRLQEAGGLLAYLFLIINKKTGQPVWNLNIFASACLGNKPLSFQGRKRQSMESYRKHPCVIVSRIRNLEQIVLEAALPTSAFLPQIIYLGKKFT